jgi:hypothetical protein
LTGSRRPLYSAGFAALAFWRASGGPCGGIGRRARLKIEFRKECWFDSGQGHQRILFYRHFFMAIGVAITDNDVGLLFAPQ